MMEDLTKGIYIPNIEAKWLYKSYIENENNNYEVDNEFLDKLLNGKLDYSFELVENKELIDIIEIIKMDDGKLYTLDIVNVKYTKKYKSKTEGCIKKSTKQLRDWSYDEGFKFNGKQMQNWKRSSGKARIGENLFVLDSIKNVIEWGRMGLKFEGDVSIASIRAYESLPLSSIIGCIEIDPNSILVVDDYPSEFNWTMSKTWLKNGDLQTETMPVKEKNSIWDGEGILSNKIFDDNEIIKGRGVALLRNRFMKCAGFCCYMEKYYKKFCEENGHYYDTYEVEDMYGNSIKVKDIMLITTPSAIKLAKFNDEVLKVDGYSGEGAWLQYWKDNCGKTFGVCKTEKPSHLENGLMNVLSYQMVNTIPFTRQQLTDLVKPELEYIDKLKTDLNFFLQEVKQLQEVSVKREEDCSDDEEVEDNENDIKIGSNIDVTGAFIELVKNNETFQNTQVFKDFRRNFIDAYVSEVRQGKIRIESDYCVACGNGMELLKNTVGEFDGTSKLENNQLYCSRFVNGENVVGFRNPHINVSNIGIQVNKEVDDLKEYFNCTPNIVFLNSINFPILSTYQGEDFDIDANLLTNNKIIVEACKGIVKEKTLETDEKIQITPIPINKIDDTGSNNAPLTGLNMSKIDHKIAQNYIGSVINLSQEINSLMNHLKYNNNATVDELNELYDRTSRLSSMSQCEIDKAKKQFEELNVTKELDKMKIGLELVDNDDVLMVRAELKTLKEDVKKEVDALTKEINADKKAKRKPIRKKINALKKQLKDDIPLNYNELEQEINALNAKIEEIHNEQHEELIEIKNKISVKSEELSQFDSRRLKPYFFKYIGDNKAKKQRAATNKKHRKELDKPIILKFCSDNEIDIKDVNMSDKKLIALLKVNDDIQKEWENAIYKKMDCPMDWLQDEMDKVKNGKKIGTVQVIQLVKKNKHIPNVEKVEEAVRLIKYLDTKIKGYKLNADLSSKDKLKEIRYSKFIISRRIRNLKLNKTDLYGVMKKCLNTVKKNDKVDARSGIESITLEILFKAYGIGLLKMFG